MRIVDDLIADPADFTDGRTELNFSDAGLSVHDVNWGESAMDADMVRRALGEEATNRRTLTKQATLTLTVREEGEVDLPTAANLLQQKVGEWQRAGGWLQRDFIYGGDFAGSLACEVHKASLSNFAGWQVGDSPYVELNLVLGYAWYSTEEIEGEEVSETAERELIVPFPELLGSAEGKLRLRVTNDNASEDLRAVIAAIECRDHPQDETADTTAALSYECEDLTPQGGAEVVADALASGGQAVEHDGLIAGWTPILGSEIDGVGHMTHRGPRRIRARVFCSSSENEDVQLKMEWRVLGSLQWTPNSLVALAIGSVDYVDVDLGESRPEQAALGDDRWEFRVMARAAETSGSVRLDKVRIEPTEQRIVVRAPEVSAAAETWETNSPGTVVSDSAVGDVAWASPGNATSSNDSRAGAVLKIAEPTTEYLKATDFGFSLPEGATPVGVGVGVERHKEGGPDVRDSSVRLVVGGVITGDELASPRLWPADDVIAHYGGSNALAGLSLTYSDCNNSGFGVAIAAQGAALAGAKKEVTARIDHVTITVYYTEAVDENRVCFAERSIEFRSDGVYRQHPKDEVWGRLMPEDGFYFTAPPGGLGGREARAIIVPSRGDLDELPDEGTNKLSAVALLRPGYLFAREAAE